MSDNFLSDMLSEAPLAAFHLELMNRKRSHGQRPYAARDRLTEETSEAG
jgi:hypothetical protein